MILPYLLPAVISGALMSFTLSLDEYIVPCLPRQRFANAPLKVYGMAKIGLNPRLNALSTLFVIATILLVLFSELLIRRKAQ